MGAGWFDNIQHLNTFTIFNLMPPKAGSQAYQTSYVAAQTVPVNAANGQTVNLQTFRYAPTSPVLTLNDPFLTSTGGAASCVLSTSSTFRQTTRTVMYGNGASMFSANCHGTSSPALGTPAPRHPTSATRSSIGMTRVARFRCSRRTCGPTRSSSIPARPDLGVQSTGRIRYIDSYGEGFYHGLQAKFDKRTSHDLSFGVAYTYSKSHGDGEAEDRKAPASRIHATAAAREESTRSTRLIGQSRISFGNFPAAQ